MNYQIKQINVIRFDGQLFTSILARKKYQIIKMLLSVGFTQLDAERAAVMVVSGLDVLNQEHEGTFLYVTSDNKKYATMPDAVTAQAILDSRNKEMPKTVDEEIHC
jgi:hypothetical protein